jgi:hypothetical protein
MPKPAPMSATPAIASGNAGEPVNANGPLVELDVGGDAVDAGASGSVVVVTPASWTLVALPIAIVVEDPEPWVVCVDGSLVEVASEIVVVVAGAVVGDTRVVDVDEGGDVIVVDEPTTIVEAVTGAVIGVVVVGDSTLQPSSKIARPCGVQFLPGYEPAAPKSNGGMMSPHFVCFGMVG